MTPREPTLSTLLVDAIQSRLLDFHVMLPVKVDKYNANDGTVDVIVLLKNQRPQSDGSVELKDYPPISDVPIAWPRCGKAWITMPLEQGDTGMVVFSDRNLSNWAASNKGEVVDPKSLGMHGFDGAVFIPGLAPTSSPIDSPNTQHMVVHTESELHLGEKGLDSNQFVALAKKVLDEMNKIRDAMHNHQHQVVLGACTAGGNTGTTSTISNPTIPSLSEPKAEKVKAK